MQAMLWHDLSLRRHRRDLLAPSMPKRAFESQNVLGKWSGSLKAGVLLAKRCGFGPVGLK
jgi:hypothetical protein